MKSKSPGSIDKTVFLCLRATMALCLLTLMGCGSDGPVLIPIKGTVEYKGATLTNGLITFNPKDPKVGRVASSPIADDGTFALSTNKAGDGAVAGEYIVTITSNIEGTANLEKDKELGIGGKSAIPLQYADPTTSGLTETIDSGDAGREIMIDLKELPMFDAPRTNSGAATKK